MSDTPRITGDWLTAPATRAVCAALSAKGNGAYFVGGCVRDALLGVPVGDIDISTDARPEVTQALAQAAGLKALPTGIDHGTITVIADGQPFEVTTFRRDVETDGRRAVIAFATDMAEDARRRDFTMNALYATPDGTVIDPLGQGLADLAARRLRFIDDPARRIAEDYLRILRFFRFHARFVPRDAGFDPDTLAAIAGGLDGLATLSRERVGAEVTRLLALPDPLAEVAVMERTGVLPAILPGATARALGPLLLAEEGLGVAPDWRLRLAALGGAPDLRLSRADATAITRLREAAIGTAGPGELGYRLGVGPAVQALALRAALFEMPADPGDAATARAAAGQSLPITARDLQPALSGPALGQALRRLEAAWIASGFSLDRAALLARL